MTHMGGHKNMKENKTNKTRVAVYGSLKKGFGNHPYHLGNASFIGEAETLPQYSLFSLGSYPGVIKGGNTAIALEIYDVTDEELRGLDRLEGHRPDKGMSYYHREEIETSEGNAWIYLLPQDKYKNYTPIEDGIWKN